MSGKKLTRRDFLRSAARVSAGAVVGVGLVVGLPGAGSAARGRHRRAGRCSGHHCPGHGGPTAAPRAGQRRDINVVGIYPHQRLHRRGWRRDAQRRGDGR